MSEAFDERDIALKEKPVARKKSQSAVRKPEPGNGQRCAAPKCGKPIEQNHKVLISQKDRNDVRHVRCAPKTWKE